MNASTRRSRRWGLCLALGVAAGAGAQTAQFFPIPPPAPGQNIAPVGISYDGLTVVGIAGPGPHAFRWTQTGGLQLLWQGGFARGASTDGSVIVGGTGTSQPGSAVRWTAGGGVQVLGPGEAFAVSADGSVVVGGTTGFSPAGQAFRWSTQGGMQFLRPMAPASGTCACDVSADGGVIVGFGDPGPPYSEAFRWTAATGTVGLGGMPGGATLDTIATAVSADGLVVAGFGDGVQLGEPFRATSRGLVGLGVLPNMVFSIPNAASGDGSVFVGSLFDLSSGPVAMIWDEQRGQRRLQDDLENRFGLTLPGWTLNAAHGISVDGTHIAGFGTNPLGQREGFLVILSVCYPDCNADGSLTIADFGCFQTRFVVSDPYADCNLDAQLTAADFACFQTRLVAGCH